MTRQKTYINSVLEPHTHDCGQANKVLRVCPPASKEAGFFYAQ